MRSSLSLVFLLVLSACGGSSETALEEAGAPQVAPGTIEIDESPAVIYFTQVDELRMREAPTTESRVLTKLPMGQRLIYLNEQSKEKITVTLKGVAIEDNWKKVKLEQSSGGKSTIGWVFGGALKEEVASYRNVKADLYVRDINFLPSMVVKAVIGLDIEPSCIYKGQIGYRKTLGGDYVKNGEFSLTGEAKLSELGEDSSQRLIVRYTGAYVDGKETGLFERKLTGYENKNVAQLFFENGRCLWSEIKGEAAGETYEFREEKPGSCTFQYLEDGLKK